MQIAGFLRWCRGPLLAMGLGLILLAVPCRGEAQMVAQSVAPPSTERPTVVTVGLRILGITSIDDRRNTYTAEVNVHDSWVDPRLAFVPAPDQGPERVYIDEAAEQMYAAIWWPHLIAINLVGTTAVQRQQLVVRSDGTVIARNRVQGQLSTTFDFRNFPFDRQTLLLLAESYTWDASVVRLEVDESHTGFSEDFEIPEWDVIDVRTRVSEERTAAGEAPYSRVTIEIEIQRKLSFYVWKVILPLLTLVAVSWIVFWMSGETLARRSGVSMTGLLTIVAYQFILSESLPRVAYLTLMDKLLLSSFVFIAATLVVNFAGVIPQVKERGWGAKIDRVCRWTFPLAFFAVALSLLLPVLR